MNTLKIRIYLLSFSLLFVTLSCNKSIKDENKTQELKNIKTESQVNFNKEKKLLDKKNNLDTLTKKKVYDYSNFLLYAKFPYKSIIDSTIVEIPICKSVFDDKKENIIDVDFGGSIYIKNEKGWNDKSLKNIIPIKTTKILKEYIIWAKIIHKDDYLLNKIDELRDGIPPDQPCLFYNEYPTYYIYKNNINDTIWKFIKSTKKDKEIFKFVNESQ